jgi:CO/xanthine dehydrogenase FAD-binding subunit
MRAMISRVANLRVRSVGTLGGNLCFADPHSCPADGEASPDYLRHLVAVHARQALREAFASAT